MALIRINSATGPDPAELAQALAQTPRGPIVLLLHGYKFAPGHGPADPHGHILALNPQSDCPRAISWPRHLGFGRGDADEGLCIAFGWPARGTLWQAYRAAAEASAALARLIATLHRLAPDRPVDVVAHSLGARVVLGALPLLPAGALGRAILIAAAELQRRAEAALASPAGQQAEIFNITSRENDLFDLLLEWLIAPHRIGERALGHGLSAPHPNWLDLQIDDAHTLTALARFGFRIAPPLRRVCHWSGYLRPGLFPLYRALLRTPQGLPLTHLRAALPDAPAPRWSRLLAPPRRPGLLPFA